MGEMICQSCSMPLAKDGITVGTNADGSKNGDYCVYCFKDGKFVDGLDNLDEYIEYSLQFAPQVGMSESDFKEYCKKTLPTLKRWKCTCTDECASGHNANCTCTSAECHCAEG